MGLDAIVVLTPRAAYYAHYNADTGVQEKLGVGLVQRRAIATRISSDAQRRALDSNASAIVRDCMSILRLDNPAVTAVIIVAYDDTERLSDIVRLKLATASHRSVTLYDIATEPRDADHISHAVGVVVNRGRTPGTAPASPKRCTTDVGEQLLAQRTRGSTLQWMRTTLFST